MPPSQIFVVRHGERLDKKDPSFSTKTDRPHDSPLTPNGVKMAETLGHFLATQYGLSAKDVVVLSSPLYRCVQTAAGITRGLEEECALKGPATDIPIYIEPCLVESAKWQFVDLLRNPAIARDGFLACPEPLWVPLTRLRSEISPRIQETRPFDLGASPDIVVKDFTLTESDFDGRCRRAAQTLAFSNEPTFEGKVVICVSHGEASMTWVDNMAAEPNSVDKRENPAYTSFMHLTPEPAHTTESEGKDNSGPASPLAIQWRTMLTEFSTPHLGERPSEY